MRFRLLCAVVACLFVVAACTGAPDRKDESERLKSTIAAMSGVSDVSTRYSNDILGGTIFDVTVDMGDATDQQIGAVAAEIKEASDDFLDYDQLLTIRAGRHIDLNLGDEFDPARVEQAAGLARALRSQLQTQSLEWGIGAEHWSIDIRYAADPGAALDAALRILDGQPAAIEVMPADGVPGPYWKVDAGFTAADKQRIDRQLAVVPIEPGAIIVQDGHLTRLTIGIKSPVTAYEDVVAVIRAVDAGRAHPVTILWSWSADPAQYDQPRWAGSAFVGQCEADKARGSEAGKLVPEAVALQQRIRDEFEKCV